MKVRGLKKEMFLYGISIGLNRGSMLLFMPIIISNLNLEQYGLYSYILAIVYILAPFLSLNLSAGIIREGAESISKAVYFQRKIIPVIILAVLVLSGLSSLIDLYIYKIPFITFAILLAGTESLHTILLAYERAAENHFKYLIIVIFKVIGFIVLMYGLIYYKAFNLSNLFLCQIIYNLIIYITFSLDQIKLKATPFIIKPVVVFSALLLPHTLAQWMMNASNKVIIRYLCGDYDLGTFSVAFSIASIAMILNSGISLVLPQNIIKNYEKWTYKKNVNKFYAIYSVIFSLIYTFLIFAMYIDVEFIHKYKNYNSEMIYSFTLNFLGFYLLGFYYYYSNIIFYHKNSKVISKVTVITSLVSIALTYFLTLWFRVIGASASVLITYFLYYVFIFNAAKKFDSKLAGRFSFEIKLISLVLIYMFFIGFLFVFYFVDKVI